MPAPTPAVAIAASLAVLALLAGCGGGSSSPSAEPTSSAARAAPTSTATPPPQPSARPSLEPSAFPSMGTSCIKGDERRWGVHFKVADETLEGIVLGTGKTGIVLAHQSGGDLCDWKPYAQTLASKGYRVLAYTSGFHTKAGVVAAAAELRSQGATKIILIGASKGGTAVLSAAASITPQVAAVVDLSGPTSLDDADQTATARRVRAPTLFVASELDTTYLKDTKTLYAAATHSIGRKLVVVPGPNHGISIVKDHAATIEAFVKKYA